MGKDYFQASFFLFCELTSEPESPLAESVVHFLLIFYFAQTFSPIFKLHRSQFTGLSDVVFPSISFYSNFANFLAFIKNTNFFLLVYTITIVFLILPYILMETVIFLNITIHHKIIRQNYVLRVFRAVFIIYNWVLLVPVLEILMNPLDCDWYSFSIDCEITGTPYIVLGIVCVVWACFLGFLLSFMRKDFNFLVYGIEFHWSGMRILIMILRFVVIIFYFKLKNSIVGVHLLLHAFGILSFLEFFFESPCHNPLVCKYYPIYLFAYESSLFLTTIWHYTSAISNDHYIYMLSLLWVISIKLGSVMAIRFKTPPCLFFNEEFPRIFGKIKFFKEPYDESVIFQMLGFFANHFNKKHCGDPQCLKLREKFLENSKMFVIFEQFVNEFIVEKFGLYLNKKGFLYTQKKKNNVFILKYIDFLRIYAKNPKKLMLDFEKLKKNVSTNSFFLQLYLKHLDNQIKTRVFGFSPQNFTDENHDKELHTRAFFHQSRCKDQFLERVRELLLLKKDFWGEYLLGFKTIDLFVEKVQILSTHVEGLQELIDRYNQDPKCKIIAIKGFSILYSIFRNDIGLAIKYEEEYQKIYAGEMITKQNNKEKLSFVDQNIVTCSASFLNFEGIIKPASKTQKFAHFFGMTKGEAQLLNSVLDLMPSFFGLNHPDFVRNFVNKPKNEPSKFPITAFALHKEGFLIPVSMQLCLQAVLDDFVIMATVKNDDLNDDQQIIYNNGGEILGVSQKMLLMIKTHMKDFNLELFLSQNFFDLFTDLKTLSERQILTGEFLINLHGVLKLPIGETESFSPDTTKNKVKFKTASFNVDFDLRLNTYKLFNKEALKVFNMSVKNMEQNNSTMSESKINFDKNFFTKMPHFERLNVEEHNLNTISGISSDGIIKQPISDEERPVPKELIISKKGTYEEGIDEESTSENQKHANFQSSGVNSKQANQKHSLHSSRVQTQFKNSKVFVGIQKIKKFVPKSFWFFFLGIFIDVVLMLVYFLLMKSSVENYLHEAFYPTQAGIIRFVRLYSCLAFSTEIMSVKEYYYLNLTDYAPEYDYFELYDRIYKKSFYLATQTLYFEYDSPKTLAYQRMYLEAPGQLVDISVNPMSIESLTYFDMMCHYLEYMKTFLEDNKDFRTYNYDFLIYLQRNYPFLLQPSQMVFAEIRSSFMSSNLDLATSVQKYVVIFIIIMFLVNLFEIAQIGMLYRIVNRLALIFLRCNHQEALREVRFLDNLIEYYDRNDDFFYQNFAEKALFKREDIAIIEEQKATQTVKSENTKPNAKRQLSNSVKPPPKRKFATNYTLSMSPLRRTKGIVLLLTFLSVGFMYFFLNYYYWSIFNKSVQEVIGLNANYAYSDAYSVSVLLCNNLLLREYIIRNPNYEALNNSSQDPAGRKAFLLASMLKRISAIISVADNELSSGTMQARGTVKDPNFERLINDDICQVLVDLGKIDNSSDFALCESIWDGAFQQGVLLGLNQYLHKLNEIAPLRDPTANVSLLTQNITAYVKDPRHQHLFLGFYFLSEALLLFYDYINQFYNPLVEAGKVNVEICMVISMSFLGFFLILGAVGLAKYMKRYYRLLALSLSIMPFEKVTEDEATMQIIDNFTRRRK